MEPNDEVLYPTPGFPIYESLIEFHQGKAVPYSYIENEGDFIIDIDRLKSDVTSKTSMLIFNNNHNPTATESSPNELEALAEICI